MAVRKLDKQAALGETLTLCPAGCFGPRHWAPCTRGGVNDVLVVLSRGVHNVSPVSAIAVGVIASAVLISIFCNVASQGCGFTFATKGERLTSSKVLSRVKDTRRAISIGRVALILLRNCLL